MGNSVWPSTLPCSFVVVIQLFNLFMCTFFFPYTDNQISYLCEAVTATSHRSGLRDEWFTLVHGFRLSQQGGRRKLTAVGKVAGEVPIPGSGD